MTIAAKHAKHAKHLAHCAMPGEDERVAADLRAQKDPAWAIKTEASTYKEWKSMAVLATSVKAGLQFLDKTRGEMPLVFHGQDSEIVYEIALRMGMKNLVYIVTSRALLDLHLFTAAMARVLPKDVAAVHVDTCCSGSTPRLMKTNGWKVAEIYLFSGATSNQEPNAKAIHGVEPGLGEKLEVVPQRLDYTRVANGEFCVGTNAPKFWAAVYAFADMLDLPRKEHVHQKHRDRYAGRWTA